MHKHAFKMGFSFKLAEAGLAPSRLAETFKLLKLAKGKKDEGEDEDKSPTVGFGADGLSSGIKPLAIGLSGALGASSVIPASIGRLGGGMLASGLANQMDTTDELRARYLIKRYRDFIQERKAQLNNKLVGEALHG